MSMTRMDEPTRTRLWEMIRDLRCGTLTTVDADGQLSSRPMSIQQSEFDGTLWFYVGFHPVARAIVAHSAVAISFSNADQSRFVSISGAAAIVKQHGVPGAAGVRLSNAFGDTRTVLIRLDVHHVECRDAATSRMATLFSQARATPAFAATGRLARFARIPRQH